jgi:type II secretory pathway component PulC
VSEVSSLSVVLHQPMVTLFLLKSSIIFNRRQFLTRDDRNICDVVRLTEVNRDDSVKNESADA